MGAILTIATAAIELLKSARSGTPPTDEQIAELETQLDALKAETASKLEKIAGEAADAPPADVPG